MNNASGCDGIPAELFQILKDDAVKVLHSICKQIWKTPQWPQDWKRSGFHSNAKEFQVSNIFFFFWYLNYVILLFSGFHFFLLKNQICAVAPLKIVHLCLLSRVFLLIVSSFIMTCQMRYSLYLFDWGSQNFPNLQVDIFHQFGEIQSTVSSNIEMQLSLSPLLSQL